MACQQLSLTPVSKSSLNVSPVAPGRTIVGATQKARLSVEPDQKSELAVATGEKSRTSLSPLANSVLNIGAVCSVARGTLMVLAGSDGPLRTRDGGYLLLNPDKN